MNYNFDERQFIETAAWCYYNSYEAGLNIIKQANKELPIVNELISFFEHKDLNKLNPEMKNIFLDMKNLLIQRTKKNNN